MIYRGTVRNGVVVLPPGVSLSFDDADAIEYAKIRHELETSGLAIGPYDLQIAASACDMG